MAGDAGTNDRAGGRRDTGAAGGGVDGRAYDGLKRGLDVVLATIGLVLLAPVFVVVAWGVRRELGSPVLFAQRRPGRHAEIFTLRKFRTMTDECGPDGQLLPDEDRLTSFGRFLRSSSLDELPELVNVLRGEMSLVGPRPLLVEYLERYSPGQARRHEVRPGITGWAQINGRNDMPWDDKLAMDVWYVDHRSLLLDLRILLTTLGVTVTRRGVSLAGHATTVPFQGSADDPAVTDDPAETVVTDDPAETAPTDDPAEPAVTDDAPETARTDNGAGPVSAGSADSLTIREARDDDLPQILELLTSSLGWVPDEQYAAFFRWKHQDNPFGRSPAWVAVDGERIVGLRVWLRWRFTAMGRRWDAVRAVDTATDPAYQGRGIFRRLTMSSLEVLHEQGVEHVFNTPNDQSRPGYLKMGWQEVGRLPVAVRFRSPLAAVGAVRARVPADKWSLPSEAGRPALEVLADDEQLTALLATIPDERIRTDLDAEVLRWRYGFAPLHYRGLAVGDGIGLFRVRRRGPATECVIGHLLAPDAATRVRLLAAIARQSRADQVIQITSRADVRAGFLPLPGAGPVLTWRALTSTQLPAVDRWDLTMGDVELF